MDTVAALGQVHMCRYLMLCSMVALTAHWTTGVPVRKIAPTPQWPLNPTPHIYIPKRFLRLWSQKQDELMMEGPSGDGPVEPWDSSLLLSKTSKAHSTTDDYTTRSPLPEEISPSQSEPFPTIIDTEIETSETFSDEFISRSSVSFQGPSSLLNTLIFRPSPPGESSSFIVPTPTLESSSVVAQTSLYDLSASWTELDELASSFTLSSRRALSYSPSEIYAIITAISATYIYQEDTMNLPINPSVSVEGSPFGSMPSSLSIQSTERVPDFEKATSTFVERVSVHLQSSGESYFDIFSTDSISFESRDSISKPQSSFSTNLFSLGTSDALIGSSYDIPSSIVTHSLEDEYSAFAETLIGTSRSTDSNFVSIDGYSKTLAGSSLLLWSPYSASIAIHTTSMSSDVYYFSNNTLDGSFAESQLSHKSSYFIPFLTPYDTVFLSNVETTVTIIDNKDTPFTYVLPTLTVTGTNFNGSSESFISYPEDFTIIPSNYKIDATVFNDFSIFKHLSSSFDTKARTFSTVELDKGLVSNFSHISMENIISVSSFYYKNLTDLESSEEMLKTISPTITYFSTRHPLSEEVVESQSSDRMSYLSHSVDEIEPISATDEEILKFTSVYDKVSETQSNHLEKYQTKMQISDTHLINEIESNQYSHIRGTYDVSEYFLPSPTILDTIHSSLPHLNETQTDYKELITSIFTSFGTEVQSDSSFLWKSTDSLDNEITKQSYKPDSELLSSIISPENSTKDFNFYSSTVKNEEREAPRDSEYNFLDPFTHHVTVRSLRDTSSFDILTGEFHDRMMTTKFESEGSLSTLLESSVTTDTTEYSFSVSTTQTTPEPPVFPTYIETLFGQKSRPSRYKPSKFTEIVTEELITSTDIARPPDIYFPESTALSFKSMHSEDLLVKSSSTTHPFVQYATSYDQEMILSKDKTGFRDDYTVQESILSTLDREYDASEIFKQSFKSELVNTVLLDSSPSNYLEVTRSFLFSNGPFEIFSSETLDFTTSVSTDYQITPTFSLPPFEEPSHKLSDLDNHFLESSNASSKVLEDISPLKSIMNKSKSVETEKEDTVLFSSFESVSNIFTSDIYTTPSLIISSFQQASTDEDSTVIQEEPRRSYFEFHESTRILEFETKLPTESSEFVRSAVYDSTETHDLDTDLASDLEIFPTQSISLYQSSELSSLRHLIPVPEESAFSLSFTQDSDVISLIRPSHSKDRNEEPVALTSKDSFQTLISSSSFFSHIQKSESESIIPKSDEFSLLSTDVKSSFLEVTALDLSSFFRELSSSSEEFSPKWPSLSFLTKIKETQGIDFLLSDSSYFESLSAFQLLSSYTPEFSAEQSESSTLILPDIMKSKSFESNKLTEGLLTSMRTSKILSSAVLLSETLKFTKHISESEQQRPGSGNFRLTSTSSNYESSILTALSPSVIKDPLSIESDFFKQLVTSTLFSVLSSQHQLPPSTPPSAKELLSIKSDHPEQEIPTILLTPIVPSHVTSISEHWQSKTSISTSIIKEPKSVESDESILKFTRTVSSPIATRQEIPTRLLTPIVPNDVTSISEHWQSKISISSSIIKEPKSVESDESILKITKTVSSPIATRFDSLLSFKSRHETPQIYPIDISSYSTKIQPKISSYVVKPILTSSISSRLQPTSTEIKIKEPLSIESEFPKPKATSILQSSRSLLETNFQSIRPQFETTSSTFYHLQSSLSKIRPTAMSMLSSSVKTELLSPTSVEGIIAPEKTDIILASILPVSSFLNVNQTRNATADSGSSGDTHSSTEEQIFPTRNTYLFKDNHYWVLTILEAPEKGQLPENFSHIMENRLANAYSEAFRSFPSKDDEDINSPDMITVKILSLTDDILLRQLEIVHVVERGGTLVPSAIAAEYLRSLRFEQLREFLGYHAIDKARPYRPPSDDVSRPVDSPLPVLAIVGGVLLGLLVIFCCFCIYCRCCRPKPAPSSPGSSTSGSLQRSLSKYGQHNRKHLFREMTHQLTSEMAAQIKHGSTAPEAYLAEKSAHSRRSLPTLPRDSDDMEKKDPAMKMLKILENKEASTSPMPGKQSRGTNGAMQSSETTSSTIEKKKPPKPKKRRKVKDSVDQASKNVITDSKKLPPESPPPTPPPKGDVSIPSAESRPSPDSGTSSRHPSSQPSSPSEKGTEENESEGSNVELLPPVQEMIDRSKSESEAAAAETQMHLSRVRQRISELLDDAFALAGGRRLYGSLRSKKIEPAADVFPRYGSFRSHSAAEGDFAFAKHPGRISIERRPISEGGQRLLGVITDEGQLITHPPPKLVWDQDQGYSLQVIERPIATEVVEARNRNINLFPFQPQRIHQLPALPSSSSLPLLDTLPEGCQDLALGSPIREAASELYLPHSARMNPATADQYDELDVVSALRNDEPVEALIQAIKDELQRFAGSLPGANDSESNA
ncbi:uncharacterized protein NPIL_178991 [Nephila pilipes]|uniref:Uncharacterized protein n=1 Tax=Nephila pilipes TaxID=299642 RepID=A0A8X6NDA6_NEPPI|nr:uncharacterized protein NPIL_178991 [Nephila pilipes]